MKKNQLARKSKMKSFMKTGIVVMLALVLILSQTAVVTFADNNGKGNNNSNTMMKDTKNKTDKFDDKYGVTEATRAELREKLKIMVTFGTDWAGLPEGMYKKGFLPYGLAKRYAKGDFPYGLAKRIHDFNYEDQQQVMDLKALQALILNAKALLTDNKTYLGDVVAYKIAITNAETFVSNYTTTKSTLIKSEYKKLYDAMSIYMNSENLFGTKTTELTTLLAALKDYRTKYNVVNAKLNALIVEVELYAPVLTKPLTLGVYLDIIERAKAFEDHLDKLKALILDAQALLLLNVPTGTYLQSAYDALNAEVTVARTFADNYTNQAAALIIARYNDLNSDIVVYKNSKVLTVTEVNILKDLLKELNALYARNGNKPSELKTLIDEITLYTNGTNVLTSGKFSEFLSSSQKYITDLFNQIIDELNLKINDALVKIAELKYDVVLTDDLKVFVKAAQDYLLVTPKTYDALMNHINQIDAKVKEMIDKNDATLVTLKNKIKDANDKINSGLYVEAGVIALEAVVDPVEAYVLANVFTYSGMVNHITAIDTAITALVLK